MRTTPRLLKFDKAYLKLRMKPTRTKPPSPPPPPPLLPPVNRARGPAARQCYHAQRQAAVVAFAQRDSLRSQAKSAFLAGNKALAHQLAGEAHALHSHAAHQNAQAAAAIFALHNPSLESPTVDLHGLHAQEAVYYFSQHLQRCITRGEMRAEVVVGLGKQSTAGGHKVGPAIVALCRQLDIFLCRGKNQGAYFVRVDREFEGGVEDALLAWESDFVDVGV